MPADQVSVKSTFNEISGQRMSSVIGELTFYAYFTFEEVEGELDRSCSNLDS